MFVSELLGPCLELLGFMFVSELLGIQLELQTT
jgi:hypothetical protein